jgi:hypothetical protein
MGYALSLYQALTRINVPEADASAVVQSLEHTMATELATKADIALLRTESQRDLAELKLELKTDIMALGNRIDLIETRLVIKFGALMTILLGLFFFALRFS